MNKRQIEKRISLIPDNNTINLYIEDSEYLYLFKKTEKIVIVTYILTDFIPDTESLKRTLKDNSHEALNSVCDLMYKSTDRLVAVQKIKSNFIKLVTQYSLAEISGFISRMNSQIIKDEINLIIKVINDFERELKDEQMPDLRQNYFDVSVRSKRQYMKPDKEMSYKRQTKRHFIKDKREVFGKLDNLNNSNIKDFKTTEDSDKREENVLDIIKEKGNVSIKDISSRIFDCSEKTIQRTLNKLIEKGKIKKEGERRWARYSILS